MNLIWINRLNNCKLKEKEKEINNLNSLLQQLKDDLNEKDIEMKELHIIKEQLENQKNEVITKKDNEINELKTTRNQVEKLNKDKEVDNYIIEFLNTQRSH